MSSWSFWHPRSGSFLFIIYISAVVYLHVVKWFMCMCQWFTCTLLSTHIQSFCSSNTDRSTTVFIPSVCICQKEWTCSSFAFHLTYSVAVSVFILGVFFYLKLYYFGLQILIFKSSLCYSGPRQTCFSFSSV